MHNQPAIPFNRPFVSEAGFANVQAALRSGHLSGDGPFTHKCHELLQQELGVKKALLTTSCTDALEMSAILLNLQPGDEFLTPSFTFVSTPNAFVLRGALPVFVDIRPDTLNIDETLIEQKITPRTKAIVVVHYAGVAAEMDAICAIGQKFGIPIVEDNAHGLFGKYKSRFLGTFGILATQSFHETKNFSCGEGGALLINDASLAERAEIIREKGTNRARFFRGQVDKYSWVDIGSSFLPSELNAALLLSQLEQRNEIQSKRKRIFDYYEETLRTWARENGITQPTIPVTCEQAYHMYYFLLPSLEARTRFIIHLKKNGILAVFHYLPLHLSDMGRKFGGRAGDCPVTEELSDRLVRLPFFIGLSEINLARIVECILCFRI